VHRTVIDVYQIIEVKKLVPGSVEVPASVTSSDAYIQALLPLKSPQ